MKTKWNIGYLPVLVLGCGGVSGSLWGLMQKFCVDDKGLLKPWNLPGILLLLISLAVVVGVVLLTRPLGGSNRYGDNFGPSRIGGYSAFAAALGILSMLPQGMSGPRDFLSNLWMAMSLLSVPALILTGLSRLKGKRPNFLLHGILCVFFGIHMSNQYRTWSSDPQLVDYAYQLAASVCLALNTYFLAAFAVGIGRRLKQLLAGLLAAYFCLACICVDGCGLFYLTCGIWAAANLCDLQPRPRRRRPAPEAAAEPPAAPSAPEEQS